MKYHYQKKYKRHNYLEGAATIVIMTGWLILAAMIFDTLVLNGQMLSKFL